MTVVIVDPLLPAHAQFLGQQSFQLRVTPVRRALLVEEGDVDQLRNALFASAAIWGGARCPVLPIRPDGSVDQRWVQVSEVLGITEVVDFTASNHGESAWTGSAAAAFTLIPTRPLDDARFWNPHPVAAMDSSQNVLELFLPGDDSLVSLAGAGGYGLPEETTLLRSNGWNIVENAPSQLLACAQLSGRTALEATLPGDVDTEIRGGLLDSLGLMWVTQDPNSFDDVVWFWNCRALRPRYLPLRPPGTDPGTAG